MIWKERKGKPSGVTALIERSREGPQRRILKSITSISIPNYIKQDINVILPLARMAEFEQEKIIGRLAPTSYSFYGFQWQNTDFLKEAIEPISKKMRLEGVEAVLMTPA